MKVLIIKIKSSLLFIKIKNIFLLPVSFLINKKRKLGMISFIKQFVLKFLNKDKMTTVNSPSTSIMNFKDKIKCKISNIIFHGFIDKKVNEIVASHIIAYHEANAQNEQNTNPSLRDLLPPPTPSQIISNINEFVKKQNKLVGHASDSDDITNQLETLSIEELNKFHDTLKSINKSLFEDHDFSIWKVEQKVYSEAFEFQKELDTREFIEVNNTSTSEDEKND